MSKNNSPTFKQRVEKGKFFREMHVEFRDLSKAISSGSSDQKINEGLKSFEKHAAQFPDYALLLAQKVAERVQSEAAEPVQSDAYKHLMSLQ